MSRSLEARKNARRLALQALYAWQVSGNSMTSIRDDLLASLTEEEIIEKKPKYYLLDFNPKLDLDLEYFKDLVEKIPASKGALDKTLSNYLSRSIEAVNPIEHAILWIGAYELTDRIDIPFRVIINEGVELAKQFGAQDSHKFINGVLDKMSKELRQGEIDIKKKAK